MSMNTLEHSRTAVGRTLVLRTRLSHQLVCLLLIHSSGCGPEEVATYKTQLLVHLPDGSPLIEGRVVLRSQADGTIARGVTDSSGVCVLTTRSYGDGVVAGTHDVIVGRPLPKADPDSPRSVTRIHDRYGSFGTSELTLVVREERNELAICLKD